MLLSLWSWKERVRRGRRAGALWSSSDSPLRVKQAHLSQALINKNSPGVAVYPAFFARAINVYQDGMGRVLVQLFSNF